MNRGWRKKNKRHEQHDSCKTFSWLPDETVSVRDFSVLLLFSDYIFSSLSSGILVHLPLALWTHVWTPLHAYQTLHPHQGGLTLLDCCTHTHK